MIILTQFSLVGSCAFYAPSGTTANEKTDSENVAKDKTKKTTKTSKTDTKTEAQTETAIKTEAKARQSWSVLKHQPAKFV